MALICFVGCQIDNFGTFESRSLAFGVALHRSLGAAHDDGVVELVDALELVPHRQIRHPGDGRHLGDRVSARAFLNEPMGGEACWRRSPP